jgi:hypothetical protein
MSETGEKVDFCFLLLKRLFADRLPSHQATTTISPDFHEMFAI